MRQNAASYNSYLTTYAQALVADEQESIGNFLFPAVQVPTMEGTYTKRDPNAAFRVYDTRLARDGSANRIIVDAVKGTFNCEPNALSVSTWNFDEMQDMGNEWREGNIRELLSTQMVTREAEALRIWRAGVQATSGMGTNWTTGQGDPIEELDSMIRAIHTAIGRMPNRMVIGLQAWAVLKNHAAIRDAVKGLQTVAGIDTIKGMLIKPDLEIKIGSLPYQPSGLGSASDKVELVGNEISIFYADDAPTRNDASAGKDFSLESGGAPEMHTFERDFSMEDTLLWSTDRQVANPAAAGRIVIS